MNHAGNPMSDTVNQPRAFEILTAEPVKKRCRPRDWPDDAKALLVLDLAETPSAAFLPIMAEPACPAAA